MTGQWIKLSRKMLNWEWYHNANVKILFLHCLLRANTLPQKFEGKVIPAGSFVTSLEHLANETGLTQRQTRTALSKLKMTNELTSKSTNRYTVITVNNWELYQTKCQTKCQTNDKQMTTILEYKNRRRDINISSSSKEKFENFENLPKIDEEEEEILKSIAKKNGVKYYKAWLRKLLTNGDYKEIIEKAKEKKSKVESSENQRKKDIKKVVDRYTACLFVGKYGDFTDENHPQDVKDFMAKYGINSYTEATDYVYKVQKT